MLNLITSPACFLANKNGSNQTGVVSASPTQITFGNEVFDVGSCFATNAWTPPAGKVRVGAQYYATGTITAGFLGKCMIYKNGAVLQQFDIAATTGAMGPDLAVIDDVANGTDAYTAYCYVTLASGTATISGSVNYTMFWGYVFA